jgi:hypothetical protein
VADNVLPLFTASMGMWELFARFVRSTSGDSAQQAILAVAPGQGDMIVSPLVVWQADTAWIVGGQNLRFKLVFQDGRAVSFEDPAQNIRYVRAN